MKTHFISLSFAAYALLNFSNFAHAADFNDLFTDKNGFSIVNGVVTISDEQKKNWKPVDTSRTGMTYEWAESSPQSELGGNNDRQRLNVEYADLKTKRAARITRVHDENRNMFAYAQNLGAETLRINKDGGPASFTSCSVYKRQDFREEGRTYAHETAGDVIAGTFGSKSEVKVKAECDVVTSKTCNALRVWSAAHDHKDMKECTDALSSLSILTEKDDAAAAGEKKIVLDQFKKLNNSTNPLWNRKLEYNDNVINDAFNAKEAQLEFGSSMRRVTAMMRACDSLGWPKSSPTAARDAAKPAATATKK